jgi:dTDP-4-amino-4,6-dideoxygalactose transaminase
VALLGSFPLSCYRYEALMDRVPLNDLSRQNSMLRDELLASAARVIDSGWFIQGKEGVSFEAAFAAYCSVQHCVGVANGTDAIELALRAAGVNAGDSVVTVANAGFYSSMAILAIGAEPLYVDVEAETQLIDIASLRRVLEQQRVSAVVVTHLYGRLADMESIASLCLGKDIPLIEDCAQAHGARRDGRIAGSFGTAGCFSFYPTKNLGALGDAGAVTTNDAAFAARLRALRQYGWEQKYRVGRIGGRNSRLDEMQAALLSAKLRHLDDWNEERRSIARRYVEDISHPGIRRLQPYGSDHVAHLFVLCCEDRDRFRRHMDANGIATDIHFPIPDHQQPTNRRPVSLPETERLASEIVTIPCFNGMKDAEIRRVVAAVNSW